MVAGFYQSFIDWSSPELVVNFPWENSWIDAFYIVLYSSCLFIVGSSHVLDRSSLCREMALPIFLQHTLKNRKNQATVMQVNAKLLEE